LHLTCGVVVIYHRFVEYKNKSLFFARQPLIHTRLSSPVFISIDSIQRKKQPKIGGNALLVHQLNDLVKNAYFRLCFFEEKM